MKGMEGVTKKLQLTSATGMDIAQLIKQDTTIGMENLQLLLDLEKTIEDVARNLHVVRTLVDFGRGLYT